MERRMVTIPTKMRNRTLHVLMNGLLVGTLTKHSHGGLSFAYDHSWLQQIGARPISLSLPLSQLAYEGDVVYNFFDNLLPDNPQIRARIQAKFRISTNQPFDLLASIGKDCVGAIQICNLRSSVKQIKAEPLTEKAIATLLRNFKTSPLGMADSGEDFRISIAGAQEKMAFLLHQGKWQRPLGTTPTTHIFKLPIGYIEHQGLDLSTSCENEWLCTQIAKEFGLPIAEATIQYFEEVKVLVVERFDRKLAIDKTWIMRLPQEDICQALGLSPNLKYESDGGPGILEIMQLLHGSEIASFDRELFFRTQILFFLLAAIDGHAKNFSIFLKPYGTYHLTPLYDIMSAHPLIVDKQLQKQKIKMAMALCGKNKHYFWNTIKRRHFIETAIKAKFSKQHAEKILEDMLGQVETVIKNTAIRLPANFPKSIAKDIFKGMQEAKRILE